MEPHRRPCYAGVLMYGEVVLLSRHGKDHTISPTAVNNRANIYALKEAGCTRILATTACGSLREEIGRGDIVIPDQLIDFTRHRIITFHHTFEPGNLKHQQMAEPFDGSLRELIISTAGRKGYKIHDGGTLITIEGPRFSPKLSRGCSGCGCGYHKHVGGPEAILANEMGIPYAVIAMAPITTAGRKMRSRIMGGGTGCVPCQC